MSLRREEGREGRAGERSEQGREEGATDPEVEDLFCEELAVSKALHADLQTHLGVSFAALRLFGDAQNLLRCVFTLSLSMFVWQVSRGLHD